MGKGIIHYLHRFDLMAPKIQFKVAGERGIKTVFGFLLSICYIASLLTFSYVILKPYWYKENPIITSQLIEGSDYPKMSLDKSGAFPVIYLLINQAVNVPARNVLNYITPKFFKKKYHLKRNEDGTTSVDFKIIDMEVKACGDLSPEVYDKYYKDYEKTKFFKTFAKDYGLCVEANPEESYVQGGGGIGNVEIVSFEIFPCTLPTGCVPPDIVKQLGIIFSTPGVSSDYSNHEKPIESTINADNYYYLNPLMMQKYQNKFEETEIYDNDSIFTSDKLKFKFHSIYKTLMNNRVREASQTQCTMEEMKTFKCRPYMDFDFMSSGRKTIVLRSYKSLTTTLSRLGGINNLLLLFYLTLNLYHIRYGRKFILVGKVFEFFSKKNRGRCLNSKSSLYSSSLLDSKEVSNELKPKENLTEEDLLYEMLDKKENQAKFMKEAKKLINENLDVVTLVREISHLKVLTRMLMKDYQIKLLPLLALSINTKQTESEKMSKLKRCKNSVEKCSKNLFKTRRSIQVGAPIQLEDKEKFKKVECIGAPGRYLQQKKKMGTKIVKFSRDEQQTVGSALIQVGKVGRSHTLKEAPDKPSNDKESQSEFGLQQPLDLEARMDLFCFKELLSGEGGIGKEFIRSERDISAFHNIDYIQNPKSDPPLLAKKSIRRVTIKTDHIENHRKSSVQLPKNVKNYPDMQRQSESVVSPSRPEFTSQRTIKDSDSNYQEEKTGLKNSSVSKEKSIRYKSRGASAFAFMKPETKSGAPSNSKKSTFRSVVFKTPIAKNDTQSQSRSIESPEQSSNSK